MSNKASCALLISDEAYTTLTMQARMLGYVSPECTTARGMAQYLTFLMECDIQDARPTYVAEQDAELLADHQSPAWRIHDTRTRHHVALSTHTLVLAAAHAFRLGIAYPIAAHINGAPTIDNLPACMSAVLEALGSEWLLAKVRQDA